MAESEDPVGREGLEPCLELFLASCHKALYDTSSWPEFKTPKYYVAISIPGFSRHEIPHIIRFGYGFKILDKLILEFSRNLEEPRGLVLSLVSKVPRPEPVTTIAARGPHTELIKDLLDDICGLVANECDNFVVWESIQKFLECLFLACHGIDMFAIFCSESGALSRSSK